MCGYYGRPWSTSDRASLMRWGGYYKLNSYFYAPKDDPKHRVKWMDLYTEEELQNRFLPLVQAAKESKVNFVYGLHPFSGGFDWDHYDESFAKLKAKYQQVIDLGVRQVALLADDFGGTTGPQGKKVLDDLTAWLKDLKTQPGYEDLMTTVPYVPYDYMGNGSGTEFDSLKLTNPDDVQLVMTGGRIWGEVTQNFTNTFTANVGRGPYMWINWPCTDNSHNHLIMGGYTTFLHPGVNPNNIQGIILNPMQQAEASKVAIFGNAAYAWNIWESEAEANEIYEASFKYVDHNNALETGASNALKELSKHMINQNMDSRVTALEESVELSPILDDFIAKMNNKTLTQDDIDALRAEFKTLEDAADTYRRMGNKQMLVQEQLLPFLDCWDDTVDTVFAYLNAIESDLNGDMISVVKYNSEGQAAYERSKTHKFDCTDGNQDTAEVGVQHIVPFIKAMASYANTQAELAMAPGKLTETYITNRSGNVDAKLVLDGNDNTNISYTKPNTIAVGDYVGVAYNRLITLNSMRFVFGGGKNHFNDVKLQYTTDSINWVDFQFTGISNAFTFDNSTNNIAEIIINKNQLAADQPQVTAVRAISTSEKSDAYLNVHEIQINKLESEGYKTNAIVYSGNFGLLNDENTNTTQASQELMIYRTDQSSAVSPGTFIQYNIGAREKLTTIVFSQAKSSASDHISDGSLQYLDDDGNWQTFAQVNGDQDQTFDVTSSEIYTTAVRILNNADSGNWWRIGEFNVSTVKEGVATTVTLEDIDIASSGVSDAAKNNKKEYIIDGDHETSAWMNTTHGGDTIPVDAKVILTFSEPIRIGLIHVHQGFGDKISNGNIEYLDETDTWQSLLAFKSAGDLIEVNAKGVIAKAVRVVNKTNTGKWWRLQEIEVENLGAIKGSKDWLYTNVSSTSILSQLLESDVYALTNGNITLKQNEYIGLKLPNIFTLTELDQQVNGMNENVKLEISKNAIEWTTLTNASSIRQQDAKFIRLINQGSADVTLDIQSFQLQYHKVTTPEYHSTNIATSEAYQGAERDMRNAGNSFQAFDGDLTTYAMIGGTINEAGKYVTFDLGQTRTIHKLRYYVKETEVDFIRDAIFEIAATPDAPDEDWVPIMEIGDGGATDKSYTQSYKAKDYIGEGQYTHDSENPGNMYREGTVADDSATGRYLRVRFTAPLKIFKFKTFYEILINDGEYVTTESTKDIVSEHIEAPNHLPSHMLDNDFTTSYKSSQKNSSFTYYLSEPQNVKSIRIISTGNPTNANVNATLYSTTTRALTTTSMKLGTLNQTISEFVVPDNTILKEVTVSWGDQIPEIVEITTSKDIEDATDARAELKTLLDQAVDQSTWTKDSITEYESVKKVAQEIYDNSASSKSSIENAIGQLHAAIRTAKQKYVGTELQTLINEMIDNEKHYYMTASYQRYFETIEKAREEMEDIENLQDSDAQQLIQQINDQKNALAYSRLYFEQAQLYLEEESAAMKPEENYTQAT